jgi:hypothetical protein
MNYIKEVKGIYRNTTIMLSIDAEWSSFMNGDYNSNINNIENSNTSTFAKTINQSYSEANVPKCSDIYISTKTNIAYLNTNVNLSEIFWKIIINDYCNPETEVVKKQMKFNSLSREELTIVDEHYKKETYKSTYIITHIDNPEGRIKFKDIRKLSIGLSKKDILSYRCKQKSAFYNCFVLIIRLNENLIYKEYHVKIFNTGKIEIPGIQSDSSFLKIIQFIEKLLSQFYTFPVKVDIDKTDTVLINSNFNCGFYINRERLVDILKYKYKIQSIYDPCSYPGIQCKFYHDKTLLNQPGKPILINKKSTIINDNITIVSFMIFRTGSVLIVGKCDEDILREIYGYIKNILIDEFSNINENINENNNLNEKNECKPKSKKIRKKTIIVNMYPKDR